MHVTTVICLFSLLFSPSVCGDDFTIYQCDVRTKNACVLGLIKCGVNFNYFLFLMI